ncbi:hypothetical protein M413DRAFT_331464 [Hebeloma cylindrosporum]|uniref:Uncharacterized protein n=1 Tax=Hebeloma cylindrosporum TaxID=76867 RepID=A0A0C2Y5N5_HEBCY|nr:hypothetical protein M413DRAFT_331464 [Hebeloma cylindrosporum h7]
MTTPVITPRLRMTRAPLYYDRNSQIASTSHTGGPSRLTEFSQLVDVDLNDMELPGSSDPSNHSNLSTPSTATRSEKPAAVLRALLSRLPADHRSLTPSQSLPQQYPSERESDYETSEPANATPSMAQESLKDIFFKARRDPGNTPQKIRARRNSVSTSEVDASFSVEEERPDSKGKRRSVSDDEAEHLDKSFNRRTTRFKPSPQPVTMEFLRERFSDSQISHMPENSSPSIHNSSNVTATLWRDLNSSHATPPAATSTPQQSLRMSINSQFQSNLLDHDTEMRHAIEDLDFNGESTNPSISPPPTVRSRNLAEIRATSSDGINGLHYTPRESNFKCDPNWNKPQFLNEGSHFSAHSLANMSPTEPEAFHLKNRGQSPLEIEHFRGHRYSPGDKDRKPATQNSQTR